MAKKKPANDTDPAPEPASKPRSVFPDGHLKRCENQVTDLERRLRRAQSSHERRELEFKLKWAKIRVANAKK